MNHSHHNPMKPVPHLKLLRRPHTQRLTHNGSFFLSSSPIHSFPVNRSSHRMQRNVAHKWRRNGAAHPSSPVSYARIASPGTPFNDSLHLRHIFIPQPLAQRPSQTSLGLNNHQRIPAESPSNELYHIPSDLDHREVNNRSRSPDDQLCPLKQTILITKFQAKYRLKKSKRSFETYNCASVRFLPSKYSRNHFLYLNINARHFEQHAEFTLRA